MNASPFQKIIFPAILASSAVFAALTLPMTSLGSGPAAAPLPEPIKQWFSPLLQHEQKKMSIRYIGFSIVSSVIAGVGTAELMRLQQNQRQRRQNLLHLLESESTSEASTVFGDALSSEQASSIAVESDSIFQPSESMNWLEGLDLGTLPAWPTDAWGGAKPSGLAEVDEVDNRWPLEALNARAALRPVPITPTDDNTEAAGLPAQVKQQPCRIQLPGSERQVLALKVEGSYYSFFRLRPSREQALTVAAALEKQGQQTLVTPHAKGHAVWVQQPQAKAGHPAQEQWQMIA